MSEICRTSLAAEFVHLAATAIKDCPLIRERYFTSFQFTSSPDLLCHPRVLGVLAKAAWSLSVTTAVDLDRRFGRGTSKRFQPDIAILDKQEQVRLVIDFESPDSSDTRVLTKDLRIFAAWVQHEQTKPGWSPPEYLVITCLPSGSPEEWELHYASKGWCNEGHSRSDVLRDPFRYWYKHYHTNFEESWSQLPISFANFFGPELHLVPLDRHEQLAQALAMPSRLSG